MSDFVPDALEGVTRGWRRGWLAAATLLLAFLLFLREPGHVLNAQFWAEDGSVYFAESLDAGFLRSFVTPFSGYLHAYPRLAAGLALLFPVAWAPLLFNLAAFVLQALPIPYLLSGRLSRHLPRPSLRVLAAALYVAVPNSAETYANLCNSQWNLAVVGLLILLAEEPVARWLRAVELILLAALALTGPFGALLLPCAALNLFARRRDAARRRWWIPQAAILAGGAIVQAAVALTAGRAAPGVDANASLTVAQGLQIISTHVFYDSVLGINGTSALRWTRNWAAQTVGLALLAVLIAFVVRARHRALLCLLYLAAVTILLSFLFPLNNLEAWLEPEFGPRYYLFAALFVVFAALLLCLRGGRLRWVGLPVAAAVALIGIPGDFRHGGRPQDTQWADQVRVFESLAPGESLFVPLQPIGFGGFTMRRRTPAKSGPPLEGLRRIPAALEPSFDPPGVKQVGAVRLLSLAGWVENPFDSRNTGRVWLVVDGRFYPAVVASKWWVRTLGDSVPHNRATWFERDVPLGNPDPGRHRIGLVLLNRDASGYAQAPERVIVGAR